ncbi:MAG: RnfABCDGE type electron transport complex subunit G [Gammaproteobacteria bacterium]|nr:RnfABCDGE type electron transport complex subunit G [Gammaproteobacteria bacterium]
MSDNSSATPESSPAPASSAQNSAAMIRTLTLIATISGLLVVMAVELTRPLIAENQRIAVEQAIFQVLPAAVSWREYRLSEEKLVLAEETTTGISIYAGFDGKGELSGIASEAAAQGYADTIRLLYGYNPECECITGIKILKSAETPGLGDKIFKDLNFIANFKALVAKLNGQQDGLENAIVTVKHGKKTDPWQIDAISGATVSSRAIGKALNDSTQYLLPRLVNQLSNIQSVEGDAQ